MCYIWKQINQMIFLVKSGSKKLVKKLWKPIGVRLTGMHWIFRLILQFGNLLSRSDLDSTWFRLDCIRCFQIRTPTVGDATRKKEPWSIHIWWSCPILKKICASIHHAIASFLNIPLQFSPESCLLLIAKNWKSHTVPTLHDWRVKCQYLLLMNKSTAIKSIKNGSELALQTFFNFWSKFINYWNKIKYNLEQAVLEIWC